MQYDRCDQPIEALTAAVLRGCFHSWYSALLVDMKKSHEASNIDLFFFFVC